MAFTFIGSAHAASDGSSSTTLDCTASLNVAAGDLLVGCAKCEGAVTTIAIAKNSGSPANALTMDAFQSHSNGDVHSSMGEILSASADATATFRATFGASRPWRGIIILQFRPDAGKIVDEVAQNTGQGTGTAATSGNISPTGSDLVVVGNFTQYNNVTLSNRQINGVAADGFVDAGGSDFSAWYRILTTGFTNGNASVTQDLSEAWLCHILALNAAAAGGSLPPFSRHNLNALLAR